MSRDVRGRNALLLILILDCVLRLAPWGLHPPAVWGRQDAWIHLRRVEDLIPRGPAGMVSVLYDPAVNPPEDSASHSYSPLIHLLTAEASLAIGVGWAVRLLPVVAWLAASLLLYKLARAWSLSRENALLAMALAGFSIEMVRMQGLHFGPQALSGLLAIGLIFSAYSLARESRFSVPFFCQVAGWTAASAAGYGSNLFHVGTVVIAAAALQALSQRRAAALVRVLGAMAAGVLAALPCLLSLQTGLGNTLDVFRPFGGSRLSPLSDLVKYPIVIGPLLLLLAACGVPIILAACRKREAWAVWLATWLAMLLPQTLVWVFFVPGPPKRLLLLVIPALALAAGIGFKRLFESGTFQGGKAPAWRWGIATITASTTAAFLFAVEIPRRRAEPSEIELDKQAAMLPKGAVVYVNPDGAFDYYTRGRRDLRIRVLDDWLENSSAPAESGSYWVVAGSENKRLVFADARMGNAPASAHVVFQRGECAIYRIGPAEARH